MLMDYVSAQEKKGYAGNYINSTLKSLKSWIAYNNKEVKIKIKVVGIDETPTLKDECVPTLSELHDYKKIIRKKLLDNVEKILVKQKVVNINDANEYLSEGLEFVAKLSNNKVILKNASD